MASQSGERRCQPPTGYYPTSVDWLIATLDLQAGHSILDLGCGPGLYAVRMGNVRRVLKPGGYFKLDVTTRARRLKHGNTNGW
mgnify:CR=1 FL=1